MLNGVEAVGVGRHPAGLVETRTWALADPSGEVPTAQQAKGELTARERITLLFDAGFFYETEKLRRHRALGFGALGFGLDAGKPYADGAVHVAVPAAAPLAALNDGAAHNPAPRDFVSTVREPSPTLVTLIQNGLSGADIKAPEQAARFVQMCDAFNVPLATLSDGPGSLPGVGPERRVISRHGAKRLCVYGEVTVSRTSLIRRGAYGGAHVVMDEQSIGADLTFVWPRLGRRPRRPQQVDRNAPRQHVVLLGVWGWVNGGVGWFVGGLVGLFLGWVPVCG
ncbi:carboxyl transferase domain-containing protein, partial [Streptomyces sp. B93]|uniref:carboxyl transferase domain-containing protein n=1 Tax=Streptomyces sp. B93 TaxID=2824875 RepID=UPI001B3DA3D4|nr:hypothetical protein [Streptomyces sp. B93]